MGIDFVEPGVVSSGVTLEAGGTLDQDVLGGGTAEATVVSAHGEQIVSGLALFTIVNSGGSENLSSGGVASGSTINAGGAFELLGGGTAFDTVVNGGVIGGVGPDGTTNGTVLLNSGVENVNSGGTAYNTVVSSGAHFYVQDGGFASGTVVSSGGYEVIQAAGVASATLVSAGGVVEVVEAGVASGAIVSGGILELLAGGIASGAIVGGGTLQLQPGGVASGAILSGGTLEIQSGGVISGSIVFASGANATLQIDGTTMPLATISGFTAGDSILLETKPTSVSYDATNHLALLPGGLSIAFDPATAPSGLSYDPATGELTACFAAGTRIATARGEITVESLREGDAAVLARGGTAPIVWLGHRRVACARHPRPWDVQPVRVRAGAFADGVPIRDLTLSPDHAVHADGALIPVRYLVNGATIVQEAVEAITYWHVELPAHDVLLAEGLAAESYLDTGNRSAFGNGGTLVQAHPEFARAVWDGDACAPLVLDGPLLARVRRRLLRRAASLGYRSTRDPALAVVADARELPVEADGPRRRVRLPEGTAAVRLVSRRFVPAQVRVADADGRTLGVAIGRIALDGRDLALDDPALAEGWHAPEPDWRWTDGAAAIAVRGAHVLEFQVAIAGTYWVAGGRNGAAANTRSRNRPKSRFDSARTASSRPIG